LRLQYEEQQKEMANDDAMHSSGIFKNGPLGIEFNHDGTVKLVNHGGQAEQNVIGLSRGDYLVQIGTGANKINTNGMTWTEMNKALNMFRRPVLLKFELHKQWERNGSNGLPYINFSKLDLIFDRFDPGRNGSFGVDELSLLWLKVHQMAIKQRGSDKEINSFDSVKWAGKLIDAHDEDNSGRLEKQEFINWIAKASALSKEERKAIIQRGGYCPAEVQFVDDLTFGLAGKHHFFSNPNKYVCIFFY
jgi:hypothetical protein